MQGTPAVKVFVRRGRGLLIARRHTPVQIPRNNAALEYYTGMRRSSAWNLKWSDVDLERGEILLPSTMTKSKKNILLRLTADAVSLLLSQPRTEGNPYVFTGFHPDGKRTERDVSVLHREAWWITTRRYNAMY